MGFSCNLEPQKLKYVHVRTIPCLKSYPRKFICKCSQDEIYLQMLPRWPNLENFVPQKFPNVWYKFLRTASTVTLPYKK